ncbi:hypothetical protein [Uliginosibacterium sediminicola]|uniref:Uncharacterized protein n=1 Tax=Uliginosibacterium sediminicola TaxID=2024550 RepID=A0ABU9Z0V8_9RHOO
MNSPSYRSVVFFLLALASTGALAQQSAPAAAPAGATLSAYPSFDRFGRDFALAKIRQSAQSSHSKPAEQYYAKGALGRYRLAEPDVEVVWSDAVKTHDKLSLERLSLSKPGQQVLELAIGQGSRDKVLGLLGKADFSGEGWLSYSRPSASCFDRLDFNFKDDVISRIEWWWCSEQ